MKVDEFIKQLEDYKDCEIDFLKLNGDKLEVQAFGSFKVQSA